MQHFKRCITFADNRHHMLAQLTNGIGEVGASVVGRLGKYLEFFPQKLTFTGKFLRGETRRHRSERRGKAETIGIGAPVGCAFQHASDTGPGLFPKTVPFGKNA